MKGVEVFFFVLGVLSATLIQFVLLNKLRRKNTRLYTEIQYLKQENKNIQIKLNILEMERDLKIEELSNIIKQSSSKSIEFKLTEESLNRLGYKCIYISEKFHYDEIKTGKIEEIIPDGFHDCSNSGGCDQNHDGECYDPGCISNPKIMIETEKRVVTETIKVIDEPAHFEVIKF